MKVLDDFVRLNVYWLDNKVITTEESALYSLPSLISDIGGQFGIWIGVSVITLSELMELIVSACIGFLRRGRNRKERTERLESNRISAKDTTVDVQNAREKNGTAVRVMKELIECLNKKEHADICRVLYASLHKDDKTAEHWDQSLRLQDDASERQSKKDDSVEALHAERNWCQYSSIRHVLPNVRFQRPASYWAVVWTQFKHPWTQLITCHNTDSSIRSSDSCTCYKKTLKLLEKIGPFLSHTRPSPAILPAIPSESQNTRADLRCRFNFSSLLGNYFAPAFIRIQVLRNFWL